MNKTWLVVQREYTTRVRKKSFLLTTILVPLIIVGFYVAIIAISISSNDKSSNKVAVIDEAGIFNGKVEKSDGDKSTYTIINNETEASFKSKYKQAGYDFLLYLPASDSASQISDSIKLFSESPVSFGIKGKVEQTIDQAVEARRLKSANITSEQYKSINSNVSVHNTLINGDQEKSSSTGVATAVAFACGILIYMILIIYGTMVMRGVMEEKMNRIAEVIVSSIKPFQLMLGKIVGIGLVGLTQFAIWIILIIVLQLVVSLIPGLTPDAMQQAAGSTPMGGNAAMVASLTKNLSSLPLGSILFAFVFYFIGGYMLYSSLFAAIGSVVSEDQQEAQQLMFPVLMPIILAFVIMSKAISDPNSGLVVFGSLFPLTSPVVMMGRIVYGVPIWQLITSMILLVLCFLFFTWLTAKIYRTGILLYGKKVTWKEMIKWAFRKS